MPAAKPEPRYRDVMATGDEALGFSLDIDKILKDVTGATRTRRRRAKTSGDMDDAVRRAVRAEVADVKRGLKALADEVVRLRRANEALADEVARINGR
jgi:hypothetical protein